MFNSSLCLEKILSKLSSSGIISKLLVAAGIIVVIQDITEHVKLDNMRKEFIADVSHELKTPIALIQGYSEGLIENVNSDEENRKFYAEVIQDEANKMDKLVKELLELMKLEYGGRKFNNTNFNIVELVNEVIRKSKVMLEENKIKVNFMSKFVERFKIKFPKNVIL